MLIALFVSRVIDRVISVNRVIGVNRVIRAIRVILLAL